MRNRLAVSMAILALLAALGSSIYLIFAPIYTGLTTDPATGQQIERTATLMQINGRDVLIPLAIPPLLAAASLLSMLYTVKSRQWLVWSMAFLLAIFVFITGFSIGKFYVPAMILLISCAIAIQVEARRGEVG